MKRDSDIERLLKRYPSDPGPEVKRSVLGRFSRAFAYGRSPGHEVGFWKRPIPLYAAAAAVILALGLSFFAGRWATAPEMPERVDSIRPAAAAAVTWEAAVNDLL
jgi:hypothetical protein